jgi:hypothetical protein
MPLRPFPTAKCQRTGAWVPHSRTIARCYGNSNTKIGIFFAPTRFSWQSAVYLIDLSRAEVAENAENAMGICIGNYCASSACSFFVRLGARGPQRKKKRVGVVFALRPPRLRELGFILIWPRGKEIACPPPEVQNPHAHQPLVETISKALCLA